MVNERNPAFRATDAFTSTAMRLGSVVRSARVFHPDGVAYRASVTVRGVDDRPGGGLGVPLLDDPGTYAGLVRFSRGAGFPEPLPDVLGLAVRIVDAHGRGSSQDLLFTSSLAQPIGRQLILPSYGFGGSVMSSVLPYRLGDAGTGWFGARVSHRQGAPLRRLVELAQAVAEGDVQLELCYASRFGPWQPLADIRLGEQLLPTESEALAFNVDDNAGGGIVPAGWVQALRRHAYAASQAGRGNR
jgi:hypothetical protein